MVRLALLSAAVALLSAVSVLADFAITQPNATIWWVAQSQNTLAWTCNDSPPAQQYTVLVGNTNQNVQGAAPIAIISQLNNYDCSYTITQDQANLAPGPGYFVQFADIINSSHVWYTSENFELKPLGSLYPSQVTSTASGGASGTGTGAGASPTGKNGATSIASSTVSLGLAFLCAFVGLVA